MMSHLIIPFHIWEGKKKKKLKSSFPSIFLDIWALNTKDAN